jgi:hypothetical protein
VVSSALAPLELTHYRSKYSRMYDPEELENNLLLVTAPGWNDESKL